MSLKTEREHLPKLILICFIGNMFLASLSMLFPMLSYSARFCWQLGSLAYLAGCCLFSAKLATDKWHISSAGFIMLSIGQGIFYLVQTAELNAETLKTVIAGIIVFIPGYIFICYYSGFPYWLRILGLLSNVPFLIITILYFLSKYEFPRDIYLNAIGFSLQQITGICWGYYAIRPYKKVGIQH